MECAAKLQTILNWELIGRLLEMQKVLNLVTSFTTLHVAAVEALAKRVSLVGLEHKDGATDLQIDSLIKVTAL